MELVKHFWAVGYFPPSSRLLYNWSARHLCCFLKRGAAAAWSSCWNLSLCVHYNILHFSALPNNKPFAILVDLNSPSTLLLKENASHVLGYTGYRKFTSERNVRLLSWRHMKFKKNVANARLSIEAICWCQFRGEGNGLNVAVNGIILSNTYIHCSGTVNISLKWRRLYNFVFITVGYMTDVNGMQTSFWFIFLQTFH